MKGYTFKTAPKANPKAIVRGENYRFTILTSRLIRYEWSEDGKFEDRASTLAINRDQPVPDFTVTETADNLDITCPNNFHLSYDKNKFSASGLMVSFDFNSKVTNWGAPWRYGETGRKGNLGGTARTLDEVNGRCDMGDGVNSRFGVSAIDDSDSMLFDGEGWVAPRRSGDRIDGYLFGYGHDYRGAVRALYAISGHQPVLPRWALGNWWSRYYSYTQDEYIGLMDKFRAEDVPLSISVIDMDWHLVEGQNSHTGWTGYTWDKKLFPDPKKFGEDLHKRHLKITLNDHPHAGVHAHETSYEAMAKALDHDSTNDSPILFDPVDKKFMQAYLEILHRDVEKDACDFWWIDWQQGSTSRIPNVDPLWMLNHFHYVDNARPESGAETASTVNTTDEKRALIFSRYAGPGSHRYPAGFSGDTIISWESFHFQPEFTATASNIGYGWWSHDIGGHMDGYRDDELTARWVQYGAFSPLLRLHSSNSSWSSKEPWCYRKEMGDVMKSYMRLRHRLVPYIYTLNVTGSSSGDPLVQPVYWHWPDKNIAYAYKNSYFFGFEIFCAPMTTPIDQRTNMSVTTTWLPPLGKFVDMFTGTVYDGDRELKLHRRIAEFPAFLHEGSIVVLDAAYAPVNGCLNPDHFEVLLCVGKNGQASVLEEPGDDGDGSKESAPSSNERGALVQFSQETGQVKANVTGRKWSFRFMAMTSRPEGLKVSLNGEDITSSVDVSFHKFPEAASMLVSLPDSLPAKKSEIIIELGANPQLSVLDHTARYEDFVRDFQMDYGVKDRLWSILNDKKSGQAVKVGQLLALGLDGALIEPFIELLCADSRSMKRH